MPQYPFVRNEGVDLKKIQQYLLETAKIVTKILDDSGIDYFLAFGTLLGQARHRGFIPWDEDFDLFLLEENYNHAISSLQSNLPSHLIVHNEHSDPKYFHAWSRIKDLRTSVEYSNYYHEDNNKVGFKCLGLDLYPLTLLKVEEIPTYLNLAAKKFWDRKREAKLVSNVEYENGLRTIGPYVEGRLKSLNNPIGVDEGYFFLMKMNSLVPAQSIFPLGTGPFENCFFNIPHDTDQILTSLFGDYMTLPPVEARTPRLTRATFHESDA